MKVRLATFVHVSDLHFGALDPTTGNAAIDAHTEPWLLRQPWFDGYLGHSGIALRHLDTFFEFMKRTESADILVTGDLSTVGSPAEIALARAYLTKHNSLAPNRRLGLGIPDALDRAVLGNHDHWPGRRAKHALDPVMLGNGAQLGSVLPKPMPAVSYRMIAPDVELALIRVDTDADVRAVGINRLLGRAAFHSQLASPQAVPRPARSGVRQVRVMLLHHSPSCTTVTLGMSKGMRRALAQFVATTDTRVLLTGHLHVAGGGPPFFRSGSLLEARCGSTTQLDSIPHNWKKRHRPPEKNVLLVHRIVEERGMLLWEVERFVRGIKGFVTSQQQRIPGGWAAPSHQIHP